MSQLFRKQSPLCRLKKLKTSLASNLVIAIVTILTALQPCIAKPNRAKAANSDAKIIVRVYNLAEVPGNTLVKSEKEAKRVFKGVGIETDWLDCPLSAELAQKLPGCEKNLGPTFLNLRIVPRFEMAEAGFRGAALGFALAAKEGGVHASIFYHRVLETAQEGPASAAQILGHAMAHEIGHLLLGSNSHSPTGMMSAQWNRKELKDATLELLRFNADQVERMRKDVLTRAEQMAPLTKQTAV